MNLKHIYHTVANKQTPQPHPQPHQDEKILYHRIGTGREKGDWYSTDRPSYVLTIQQPVYKVSGVDSQSQTKVCGAFYRPRGVDDRSARECPGVHAELLITDWVYVTALARPRLTILYYSSCAFSCSTQFPFLETPAILFVWKNQQTERLSWIQRIQNVGLSLRRSAHTGTVQYCVLKINTDAHARIHWERGSLGCHICLILALKGGGKCLSL